MRRLLLLLLCVLPLATEATVLIRWDVLELAKRSTAVVQGRVQKVSSRWSGDGMRIWTDVEVQVESVWRGQVGGPVRIAQLGGVIEGFEQRVDGMAGFVEGEEVVVFLEAKPGETFALTGMAQGKYRVDRSQGVRAIPEPLARVDLVDAASRRKVEAPIAPIALETLRAQVRAAP